MFGIKIHKCDACKTYRLFSGDLEAMLSTTEKGKIHYDHFKKNAFWGFGFNVLGGGIIFTDIIWYINDADSAKSQGGLFYGSLAGGAVLGGIGNHCMKNAANEFFLALKEYNTVSNTKKQASVDRQLFAGTNISF